MKDKNNFFYHSLQDKQKNVKEIERSKVSTKILRFSPQI